MLIRTHDGGLARLRPTEKPGKGQRWNRCAALLARLHGKSGRRTGRACTRHAVGSRQIRWEFVYAEYLEGCCIMPPDYADTPFRCATKVAVWPKKSMPMTTSRPACWSTVRRSLSSSLRDSLIGIGSHRQRFWGPTLSLGSGLNPIQKRRILTHRAADPAVANHLQSSLPVYTVRSA